MSAFRAPSQFTCVNYASGCSRLEGHFPGAEEGRLDFDLFIHERLDLVGENDRQVLGRIIG